ncbi:phosphotransferase family protein [Mycolicibacterium sp.]|uniref:phosphotransferase family protein n=1 Tax=Mycolicibacterium sp. TaxID=2320850 RepID=UPI0037C8F881
MTVNETAPVGIDVDRVCAWVSRHLPELPALQRDSVTVRMLDGGRSNLTYHVTDGTHGWVLRRPPLGKVLTTAHDMVREHTMLDVIARTGIPVPTSYGVCDDPAINGSTFQIMEFVEGTVYRSRAQLADAGPPRARAISARMVDTLAALHNVDVRTGTLQRIGRPDGYLVRQLRRWTEQFAAADMHDMRPAAQLRAQLLRTPPPRSRAGVVHGDYRLDNLIIDSADRLAAVLDWEMATVGDPLLDVALLLIYQRLVAEYPQAPMPNASSAPGFLTETQIVRRYEQQTGAPLTGFEWHLALASYKLAAILAGVAHRHARGQVVGPGFEGIGDLVHPVLLSGLRILRKV